MEKLTEFENNYIRSLIISDIKKTQELLSGETSEKLEGYLKEDIQWAHNTLKKLCHKNEDVCEICHRPFYIWCEGYALHTCIACTPAPIEDEEEE